MDEFTEREVSKRYGNTFCMLRHKVKDESYVIFLRGVGGGIFDTYIYVNGQAARQHFKSSDWEIAPMPDRRLFSANGCLYLFGRRPERQWQIGLTSSNSEVINLCGIPLTALPKNYRGIGKGESFVEPFYDANGDFVKNIFVPKYTLTIRDAVKELEDSNKLGTAITHSWGLTFGDKEDSLLLWHYEFPVARIFPKKRTMEIEEPLFKQEIHDLMKRTGEFYYE